jgi:hypothetical protein
MTFINDSRFPNSIVDLANELIEDYLMEQEEWTSINPQADAQKTGVDFSIREQDEELFLVRTTTYTTELFGDTKVHVFTHNLTTDSVL